MALCRSGLVNQRIPGRRKNSPDCMTFSSIDLARSVTVPRKVEILNGHPLVSSPASSCYHRLLLVILSTAQYCNQYSTNNHSNRPFSGASASFEHEIGAHVTSGGRHLTPTRRLLLTSFHFLCSFVDCNFLLCNITALGPTRCCPLMTLISHTTRP